MEDGKSKGPETSLRSMLGCHVEIHSFSVSSVISVVEEEREVWLRPQAALGSRCTPWRGVNRSNQSDRQFFGG